MAYVLSISKVDGLSGYIKNELFNKPASFERSGFLAAIDKNADFKTKGELMDAVKWLFAKYSHGEEIFLLYKKYSGTADITFLEERLATYDKKKVRELQKVIGVIHTRKREHQFPSIKKRHVK